MKEITSYLNTSYQNFRLRRGGGSYRAALTGKTAPLKAHLDRKDEIHELYALIKLLYPSGNADSSSRYYHWLGSET